MGGVAVVVVFVVVVAVGVVFAVVVAVGVGVVTRPARHNLRLTLAESRIVTLAAARLGVRVATFVRAAVLEKATAILLSPDSDGAK